MDPIHITDKPSPGQAPVEELLVDPVAYLHSLGIGAELVAVAEAPIAPAA